MTEHLAVDQALTRIPTLRERFWRAVGFHYHHGDEPEGTETLQGWSYTNVRFQFGWPDRLRLLLTGRLKVVVVSHFDAPSPDIVKNRIDWLIAAPGEDLHA